MVWGSECITEIGTGVRVRGHYRCRNGLDSVKVTGMERGARAGGGDR